MATQDQIKKLNDQIQEINKQLGGKQIKIFDVKELNEAERVVKSLRTELQDATNDISGIASGFKNVVQEMQNTSKPLADAKKSFNALSGLAQKLQNDQVGINKLSKKELISIQDKIKAEKENQKTLYTNLKQKYDANLITDRELAALAEIEGTLANENVLYNDLLTTVKKRLTEEEKINDAMGLGGALIGGLKSSLDKLGMGGLVNQLGIDDAQEAMSKVADEVTKGGTETAGFGGKVKVLKAGMGSLGKSMVKNLTDPLAIAKFLGDQLIKAIISVDKATGDLAKSMNVSYQESLQIQSTFQGIAAGSNSIFVTGTKLAETQGFINKELGTTVMLTNEQLTTMTKLREAAGFTNEELAGIAKISVTTGKEMETITGEVLAQAKISSTRLGVVINERDVVKEISKVSAATTLSLGKNPKAIAEAVATAKSLGMELSKIDAIAGSILNFESSIEDELSAELLIGKELNLEAARYYAQTNQTSKLAEELAGNFGTAAEFGNMGRIQQEALAKAVGMNREELAQTLFVQEQLAGVSGKEAENREKVLNARIAEVGLAQATQEIADGQLENLENQASVQARINATMEKLSEVFATIAPLVLSIADILIDILEPVVTVLNPLFQGIAFAIGLISEGLNAIKPVLKVIGVLVGIIAIGYAAIATAAALASAFTNPIKFAVGAGLALAGIGIVSKGIKASKADDLMSSPTGGSGYGDRILVGKEGAYAFNNRDTIQASTQGSPTQQSTSVNNRDTIQASTQGSPTQQSTSVVETKLYIDNEAFAQASSKSFSKL